MRRFLVISFFTCLLIGLWSVGLRQGYLNHFSLPDPILSFFRHFGLTGPPSPAAAPPVQTSPQEIFTKINLYRQNQALAVLSADPALCSALNLTADQPLTDAVLAICPQCTRAALVTASAYVSPNELLTALIFEDATHNHLLSPTARYLCPTTAQGKLALLFVEQATREALAQPSPTSVPVKPVVVVSQPPKNFTEAELWQALVNYRQAHQRSSLIHEESICQYARKRVQDQINLMAQTDASAYPNSDKYPLDDHQGFNQDADSGLAFDLAGKNHLAENLAYWPDAQYAHQIIEWGWDTSTEGHREAQLSNDWTHACLAGSDGFYVAIFGY